MRRRVVDMNKKIKVAAYCDSPTCATGFATVSRNIFEGLYKTGRYDIDIFGINYWGDPHEFPYKIWPAGTNLEKDPYGRQKAVNMFQQMEYDILFFLQDTFILNFLPTLLPHLVDSRMLPFKSIVYYPVDSIIKESWAKNISNVDYIVAYSNFGKQETLKVLPDIGDIQVIPHGVNINDYYPLDKEIIINFKRQYFGNLHEKFIITNLNRNQQRKDIPRFLMAFKEFRKHVPDSIAYCHMAMKDQGWDLNEVCDQMGFDIRKDVIFPQNFGPNQGYPKDVVNMLYNCSDIVTSTTLGEGFGLAWIEAMATKTPVVMPDNTAMAEFISKDRGYLVKSGSNPSLWTVVPHDNEVLRPLVDVDDMVKQWLHIYNHKEEAVKRAENAFKWVTTKMDWQTHIAAQWVNLFDLAYSDLQKEQDADDVVSKIGKAAIQTEEV